MSDHILHDDLIVIDALQASNWDRELLEEFVFWPLRWPHLCERVA